MHGPICFAAANEGRAGVGGGGVSFHFGGEGGANRNSLVYLQCLAPRYRVTKLLPQLGLASDRSEL